MFDIVCDINLNRYRDKYLSTGFVDYDCGWMSLLRVLGLTTSIIVCFTNMSTLSDLDGAEMRIKLTQTMRDMGTTLFVVSA